MTLEAFGGNPGPVLAPYEAFYALPFAEQRRVLHERSFEEQVDIYLLGENTCRGSELETELAKNADGVVPVIVNRLEQSDDWRETLNLLDLLYWLEGSGSYPVAARDELMSLLERVAASSDMYSHKRTVIEIREHGERRRPGKPPAEDRNDRGQPRN